MVGGTGVTVVKYLLFLFNLIFWLSGLGIIGVGAYVQITSGPFLGFYGQSFIIAPIILIVTGVVVCILGFLGCCGAVRENYCMLITFAVFLGIIFACEVAAGITAYVLRHLLENAIKTKLQELEDKYNPDTHPHIVKTWDDIQQNFQCCGVTSYGDWSNEEYYERTKDVPDSCCVNVTKGCGKNVRANMATVRNLQEHRNGPGQINQPHHQNEPLQHHQEREDRVFSSHRIMKRDEADTEVHITKNLYTDGCVSAMKRFARKQILVLGAIGIGIGCLQILGIILSCILGHGVRRGYDTV